MSLSRYRYKITRNDTLADYVGGIGLSVDDGVLVIELDEEDRGLVVAYAPGAWLRVENAVD